MTYQQYSDNIKLCAYLGKEPGGDFKEFYDFITELWKDMEFSVIDGHNGQCNGHTIILHKGKDFYMEQDIKNGRLICDWSRIWSFFKIRKSMTELETQDFIRGMVEEHLKCKVSTLGTVSYSHFCLVEEHLKCQELR